MLLCSETSVELASTRCNRRICKPHRSGYCRVKELWSTADYMTSSKLLTASGVPQGSVLKLILLQVSINDWCSGTEYTSARFWMKPNWWGKRSRSSRSGLPFRGKSEDWRYRFKETSWCSPKSECTVLELRWIWLCREQLCQNRTWESWRSTSWMWVSSVPLCWRRPVTYQTVLARSQTEGQGKWIFHSIQHIWNQIWRTLSSLGLSCSRKTFTVCRPTKGNQDGKGAGLRGVWGEAERTGFPQSGEQKAKGGPYCFL